MPVRKQEALKLRLQGKSYNEIHAVLGISKATLSGWFSGLVLSDVAQARLKARVHQGTLNGLVRRNKMQTHLARERARITREGAMREVPVLTPHDLFLVGVVLYWSEGYKRQKMVHGKKRIAHPVSLASSDAQMVVCFIRFLVEVMGIPKEKLFLEVRLFEKTNPVGAMTHWQRVTGFSKNQLKGPTYVVSKSSQGKRPYNRLLHGTVAVGINDTPTFYRLMGWIEEVQRQFGTFI
ncbi:MAG: helix-turn-helix domain-containing protein [Candidatus Pacebacteria bacterium]|nr:helix-turn-helix domain-containing protein [Candidatus Paceibacterota bacterium]